MWCSSRIYLGTVIVPIIHDLNYAAKVLIPIVLAGNTNPFFSHIDINILFKKMNEELAQYNLLV